MNNFVYALIFAFQFNLIQAQDTRATSNNFTLEGEIRGVDKGRLELFYGGNKVKERIEDGKFLFKGHIDSTYRARLKYRGYKSKLFYLDSAKIKVSLYKDKVLDK